MILIAPRNGETTRRAYSHRAVQALWQHLSPAVGKALSAMDELITQTDNKQELEKAINAFIAEISRDSYNLGYIDGARTAAEAMGQTVTDADMQRLAVQLELSPQVMAVEV